MNLLCLAGAILVEVAGTTCLKLSDGFRRPVPSVLVVVFYLFAFYLLSLALRTIPVGVAYAVWAGAGTILVALVGVFLFREPATILKGASILLIVAGVAGLQWSMGGH